MSLQHAGPELQGSRWSGATWWELLNNDRRILDPRLAGTSGKMAVIKILLRCFGVHFLTDYKEMLETRDSASASTLPEGRLPVLSHWSWTTLHIVLSTGKELKAVPVYQRRQAEEERKPVTDHFTLQFARK